MGHGLKGYAPYGSIEEPSRLGLAWDSSPTRFGRVYYARTAQTGTSVSLFLHGVGATWATWSPLLQAAHDLKYDLGDMVLVDLPGFGASENLLSHLNAAVAGDELHSMIRGLGWRQIRLVGHSMGGFLALDMASRHLAGICAAHIVSGAYFTIAETAQAPLRALAANPRAASTYLSLVLMAKTGRFGTQLLKLAEVWNLMPYMLGSFVAHPKDLPPSVVRYMGRSVAPRSFLLAHENGRRYDPAAQWSRISMPLRATFGAEDHLVPPRDLTRLIAAVPHAVATCIDDVAHFGHVERPDLVLAHLFPRAG